MALVPFSAPERACAMSDRSDACDAVTRVTDQGMYLRDQVVPVSKEVSKKYF